MPEFSVAVVVGNPKPASRTLTAAVHLARELSGEEPGLVVDLATLGAELLDWSSVRVAGLVEQVGAADLVVVASPTYKGTYTGLLKLFLDRFAGGTGLRGLAVPLQLGASPAHSLAPELTLRPLLAELGATVPGRGLYVIDRQHEDPAAYEPWLEATRPRVLSLLRSGPSPVTFPTNQDLDPVRLREAFGAFPTGVVAVAAEVDGAPVGLAASSFTSVSLDPPLVSINLSSTSKTWPDLRRAGHVGLTVLAGHHGPLCRQLAGPVDGRFDGVALSTTPEGAVFVDDGLVRFDATIYREVEAGDHLVVLLEVHAVEHAGGRTPLVFHRSAFGQLAS